MRPRITQRFAGFSLIELTVAMAIFSMGLGSLSLVLLLAIQGTAEARYRTVATLQAHSLAEAILMNSDAVGHFIHPPAPLSQECLQSGICSASDHAGAELAAWESELATALPHGAGLVCRDSTPEDGRSDDPACDGADHPVIKVFWQEPGKTGEEAQDERLISRLPQP
jgi:type IV pilus assembly protein PilV